MATQVTVNAGQGSTQVTVITGEGSTSYKVEAGSRGPVGATGATGPTGPAGSAATVDQTIIDGSVNAVAGNAVFDALALKAPLASPTFTGVVTAPRITGRCDGLEVLCKAGLAITAGQVVYVTGASGNNIVIGLAQANAEATSSKTIGISESTLANNATGYVITEGLLTVSISAPTAVEGDPIWLSTATAGGMVFGAANKPSAPNHIVYLGVVTRKTGNTVVEIYVKIQNGAELDELADVLITSPVAGQALMRGATTWQNRSLVSSDISDATAAATANTLALRDATGASNFAAVGATTVTASSDIATTGVSATISTGGNSSSIFTLGANASIYTSGANASIGTVGANAIIYTFGSDASIYTAGANASIYTLGEFAAIETSGASATIGTTGEGASIYTSGIGAIIYTLGANAYIQSRSTFKLFNGSFTTTLSHSPTFDRAIAFPDKAGTVAMIDAETHTGAHAFSSTTRPTSAGTGTPAATSLITTADGDARYGSSVQFVMGSDAAITAATFANVTGATVALEASSNYSFEGFLHIEALAALSRVQCRLAYTGTLQTVQGMVSCPQTNGSVFAMTTGALLTTNFADVSSLDRVFHVSGFIRTSTAGTLTLTSYRVSGSGSPTIKAGSQMRFRKL